MSTTVTSATNTSSSSNTSLRPSAPLSSFAPLTTQPMTVEPRKPRHLAVEWLLAGSATMSACLFSNPMEVVKTRMQVQNELLSNSAARASSIIASSSATSAAAAPLRYKNAFQAFYSICRTEGLRGIQGGLGPSLLYQLTMNGTRLGLYEPLKRAIARANGDVVDPGLDAHMKAHTPPKFWHNVCASGISGAIGSALASPFFLVKVRMQIQSKTPAASSSLPVVGTQHHYTSAFQGLSSIYRKDGVIGLWRGSTASIIRVTTGSMVQLSTYDSTKHRVLQLTGWKDGLAVHFTSSLLTGLLVAVAMNPPDVISTRLYNQPVVNGKGILYSGWLDCATKTFKIEGPRGLFKGLTSHYLRLGPHTILTFVFWEKFKAEAAKAGF